MTEIEWDGCLSSLVGYTWFLCDVLLYRCFVVLNRIWRETGGAEHAAPAEAWALILWDHLETVPHIFWHCSFVKKLWYEVSVFITEKILFNFILHFENVVFGYFIQDNVNNEAFVINLFILLVKFHIHKCKFSNRKPCFTVFYKELESYFCTIQSSANRKAIKNCPFVFCLQNTWVM